MIMSYSKSTVVVVVDMLAALFQPHRFVDLGERLVFVSSFAYDVDAKAASESSDKEKTYELPDGNIITVGSERFRCPEVLFQPSFIGKEASGIHDTT